MNRNIRRTIIWLTIVLSLLFIIQPVTGQGRSQSSLDANWRFFLGDPAGAETQGFDDRNWRTLDLPHDWSIEGPFDQMNATGGAGAFLPGGIGWYRRVFEIGGGDAKRRVFIEFDGVMANSDVWVNGVHLGKRPYGYSSFRYELTGHLNVGKGTINRLAVRVDNSAQPASRWYSGAGIYRHVRLVITDAVHVDHWGTFVTTPRVSSNRATVHVRSTVINQSNSARDVSLRIELHGPDTRLVRTVQTKSISVAAGGAGDIEDDLEVTDPQRWDLEHPLLYRVVVKVIAGKQVVDTDVVDFGIRESRFEAESGFWLNGRNLKIKGVCLHHDGSSFGAAVPLSVWARRLAKLKELGINAIRTAHNPPAPEFLDLCDRMGLLVMDEVFDCWTVAKNPYDYHLYFNEWSKIDTADMVRRDRNHPSIVVYSAGNEIHDTPNGELAKRILAGLVAVFHQHDPTRPVSQGLFRPNVSHDYDNGLADLLDVVGQNYRENEILAAHKQKPTRKILGTENTHDRNAWLALRDNAPYAGQFLWSGIDYLGESRRWPGMANSSGLLDRTGTPRPRAFERQSWWSDRPMVYIARRVAPTPISPTDPGYEPDQRRVQVLFPDWNPQNAAAHVENVEVYSNCEDVELFLNGRSLGAKPLPRDASARTWAVPFAPGSLKAIARNQGQVVATQELRTAGNPFRIVLAVDRNRLGSGWDEVAYTTATVVDENGVTVPNGDALISFVTIGPGKVIAVDSGDNSSHELFQASARHAFQGRCFAVIRALGKAGRITIVGSAPGLASGSVTVSTGR
jgi:beta-galactosidase